MTINLEKRLENAKKKANEAAASGDVLKYYKLVNEYSLPVDFPHVYDHAQAILDFRENIKLEGDYKEKRELLSNYGPNPYKLNMENKIKFLKKLGRTHLKVRGSKGKGVLLDSILPKDEGNLNNYYISVYNRTSKEVATYEKNKANPTTGVKSFEDWME